MRVYKFKAYRKPLRRNGKRTSSSLTNSDNRDRIVVLKNTNLDADDLDWITMNGARVPIRKGQSKEQAVKSFINKHESERRYTFANKRYVTDPKTGEILGEEDVENIEYTGDTKTYLETKSKLDNITPLTREQLKERGIRLNDSVPPHIEDSLSRTVALLEEEFPATAAWLYEHKPSVSYCEFYGENAEYGLAKVDKYGHNLERTHLMYNNAYSEAQHKEAYENSLAAQWFPKGTDYRGTSVHEISHIITAPVAESYGITPDEIMWAKYEVSEYAGTNAAEAIAESFTSAFYNRGETPNAGKEIIRRVAAAEINDGRKALGEELLAMIGD